MSLRKLEGRLFVRMRVWSPACKIILREENHKIIKQVVFPGEMTFLEGRKVHFFATGL